jgi:hypothetical protein
VKYRFAGKERLFSAGTYPAVTLEAARVQREKVKALLRDGRDPVQTLHVERANAIASFESMVADWLAKQKTEWSTIHYRKSARAFERDVLPRIGKLPIKDITPPDSSKRRSARITEIQVRLSSGSSLQVEHCTF